MLRSDWAIGLRALVLAPLLPLAATVSLADSPVPDRQAGAAALAHFRDSIWGEPLYAEFDLRQMPRRGDEHVFHGRFWGGRNEGGPFTRFEVDVGKGGYTHRVLVQGGADGAIWTADAPGAGVEAQSLAAPLAPGVEMTPLDVLPMPYLFWLDADLVGVDRIRGRPAYVYVFTPSADFAARNPGIRSVRAYLDTQYDALVQSEVTGPNGHVAKTLSLLELRKVGDRWIPRDLDVRNESTRDKTRLSVTAVAIGISVDPSTFDPSRLGAAAAPPPGDSITRVTQ
jgi:hypothetical protein